MGEQFGVELACGFARLLPQQFHYAIKRFAFLFGSRAKLLSLTVFRGTKITNAASGFGIGKITKVPYQGSHAALVPFRKAQHMGYLFPPLLTMGQVRATPIGVTFGAIFCEIQDGAAMNPQFFQGLIEHIGIYASLLLQLIFGLRIAGE